MFERVLVANRGEIARRVMRTCRRLGVATVAVHSDVDADEPHVHEADAAVGLGPAPPSQSYLDIDAVVAAAIESGADAVHPGYGFLAENAAFAERVAAAGLTFVGPSPEVIRLMGDKAAAKRELTAAGVPVVPGTDDDGLDDTELVAAARELGPPLVVKAVAGGGGKGMRTVTEPDGVAEAVAAARREAAGAFGDDRLILERLVRRPRHIEVQVFGDGFGHVVHLLERECSIQRRHQKIVEECPSPAVDEVLRDQMGAAAVTAARTVGYEGAGTVEFLVAGDTLGADAPEFFFLEMNTRLQVEHPVTEEVTGLDLVELQLRVAAGEPLGLAQADVRAEGHAIEVRLYAEDPVTRLPQTGTVDAFHVPAGPDVRVDSGVEPGSAVTRFYDPMLAKLVVHAPDRDTACRRMGWLLGHTTLHGVVTNVELLAAVVGHTAFAAGELTTGFLEEHLSDWRQADTPDSSYAAAAIAVQRTSADPAPAGDPYGPWDTLGPFRPGRVGGWRLTLTDPVADEPVEVELARRDGHYRVRVHDRDHEPVVVGPEGAHGRMLLDIDGIEVPARVSVVSDPDRPTVVWVHVAGTTRGLEVLPATRHLPPGALAGGTAFTSPMPGSVLAVKVEPGTRVTAGAVLVVVEAMKMEHPVTAPADGTVTAVHVTPGDGVDAGSPLVAFEVDPTGGG